MCYPVTCQKCGKTTWAGCGKHKDMVMNKVPEDQRCKCPREDEEVKHEAPNKEEKKEPKSDGKVKVLNDIKEMNDFIQSGKLIFLDFYATWCPSCKQLMPVIDEVAKECAASGYDIKFGKVNGEDVEEAVEEQSLDAFPTIIIFKEGKEVFRKKGKGEKKFFMDEIKKHL